MSEAQYNSNAEVVPPGGNPGTLAKMLPSLHKLPKTIAPPSEEAINKTLDFFFGDDELYYDELFKMHIKNEMRNKGRTKVPYGTARQIVLDKMEQHIKVVDSHTYYAQKILKAAAAQNAKAAAAEAHEAVLAHSSPSPSSQ